ncbi:MAG: bi-domain-containing oxidoreductase [Flavobacteriales bacterium]|nr:bi-domain-containing oxidoreductase [Flavobacteriales bacterium]
MDQLLQSLKKGDMEIASLPNPTPKKGEVLVRTAYSAISTGTEGKTVSDARKGYVAKAKARKEEVAKVVKAAQTYGVAETYKMVMNKLESLQPLGYSLSGEVVQVGEGVSEFVVGDKVACGGASAAHAELVTIPKNLCVKLSSETDLQQAAFTTIGAIAMQGIRRADLKLGENCVVIGLGLIGQLTLRLLKAAGVKTFGVDLKQELIDLAIQSGADDASLRSDELIEERIKQFTQGNGVDAVIITAGTSSTDPVEFAGQICRTHGKVVIVGAVPTGFSRKQYYRKELELLMSTSYGPGRYDANYEEKGLDYPIGQVRWTENRNMQAFAHLLGSGQLDIADLISHEFPFEDAKPAFDLIVDNEVSKMGVVLRYDTSKDHFTSKTSALRSVLLKSDAISFIGAGSFAGNFLLPNLKDKISFSAVATSRSHSAENAKRKFGFGQAFANAEGLLKKDAAGAVAIATRHDTHAKLATAALQNGKRVFVEKPLCLYPSEISEIKSEIDRDPKVDLMVGFNRRFAPSVTALKAKLVDNLPKVIFYRINAGKQPDDHWIHDPEVGGGRLLGEACHFVDLCYFLAGAKVIHVSVAPMIGEPQNFDSFTANLSFSNGSVASIVYLSNGNKSLPKEYIEVSTGGFSASIDDFKKLSFFGKTTSEKKFPKQDKGHQKEMELVAESLNSGKPFPISIDDVFHSTWVTFAMLESAKRNGEQIRISEFQNEWTSPKES